MATFKITFMLLFGVVTTVTSQVCIKRYVEGEWITHGDCGNLPTISSILSDLEERAKQEVRCGDEGWKRAKSLNETGGVVNINIPGLGIKEVYCDMRTDGGGWIVFQRRMDGSEDFYRKWKDYVKGFGTTNKEFWLGLEAIHQLTKDGNHELRIDMIERNGTYFFAKYSSIKVDSASTNYTLSADGFSGNASESFKKHSGFPFSTNDRNNGNGGGNCAEQYEGAWWYYSCHEANLNGRYNSGSVDDAKGLSWNIGKNKWMYMKFTEMKLRKKN